jgi:ribosomal-protein-alanine N-acetyltransferase
MSVVMWPMELRHGLVGLRPLRSTDSGEWSAARQRNANWLRRWDATQPSGSEEGGAAAPGKGKWPLVGQLTVSGITYGSARWASLGYWVDEQYAGRGIVPTAVAMAADHCWFTLGLHRIEVAIRPENKASLRVVEKLGFRDEGYRPRFLHINGKWADHRSFALTSEEVPEGLLRPWLASHRS